MKISLVVEGIYLHNGHPRSEQRFAYASKANQTDKNKRNGITQEDFPPLTVAISQPGVFGKLRRFVATVTKTHTENRTNTSPPNQWYVTVKKQFSMLRKGFGLPLQGTFKYGTFFLP